MAAFGVEMGYAASLDDFEGPQTSWRPGPADLAFSVEQHQRVTSDAHAGRACEYIQISAGAGTFVYFVHDLSPARIAAELTPAVWIKANRPGVQVLARVVLPHTPDPRTGRAVTTVIRGSSYSSVGQWQQLHIGDTPQLVSRQLRVLRAEIGPNVDAREAYVDQVLLNVYGGPGQTVVKIDELTASGVVPHNPSSLPAAVPNDQAGVPNVPSGRESANGAADNNGRQHTVSVSGSLLQVDGRPAFPRVVQWQGEPLGWLKERGFSVVHSKGPLTAEMLEEARRLNIWLIGPPPIVARQPSDSPAPLAEITAAFGPVLAWQLGHEGSAAELPAIAALAKQLRGVDRDLGRPLISSPQQELLAYSRQVDLISVSRQVLGTSLDLKDYGKWLSERARFVRSGTPLWTTVQTEASSAVLEQTALLSGKRAPEPTIDMDSVRLQVYQAIMSGMRGIEFASNSRLDAGDNSSRLRAASLALLNLELELLEPWGAAGQNVGAVTSSNPDISGIVLQTDSARLVLAVRCPKDSQYVAAPQVGGTDLPPAPGIVPIANSHKTLASTDVSSALKPRGRLLDRGTSGSPLDSNSGRNGNLLAGAISPFTPESAPTPPGATTLVVPGVPEAHNVYELTPGVVRPLRHKRIAGGTSIAVDNFPLTAAILITPDPLAANTMSRRAASVAPLAAQLQREIAAAMLEEVEAVDRRVGSQPQFPSSAKSLTAARIALQRANQAVAAGDYASAYFAAREATIPLGRWKHEEWQRSVGALPSPVASPLATCFNTLPDHLLFMASVARLPPGENLLIGGNFENLQTMLQAGWRHFEHSQNGVQTVVELSPDLRYSDRFSLRLQARQSDPKSPVGVLDSSPLWVTSAPVHLSAGEIVCIRGQVRVSGMSQGNLDGLMIIDSIGGEPLAQRVGKTDGWREFVMYRVAPQADNLTVTFALTGLGEAWIDDISIRPLPKP